MATASRNASYRRACLGADTKTESRNRLPDQVLIPVPEGCLPLEARRLSPYFAFVVLVPKSALRDHTSHHTSPATCPGPHLNGAPDQNPPETGEWVSIPTRPDMFVFGDITISLFAMETRRKGELVALTLKEFNTLTYMIQNAGRVIPRDELLNQVWGYECYPCTRTVDNHILRLRQKLETEPSRPKHFLTVHSAGYKFLP